MANRLSRYVAVGDSFTEGLDDLRDDGSPRGWADRVADVLSQTEPGFRYSNLAVRSLRINAIVDTQVPAAVAMCPDLVTIAGGGNDILGLRTDVDHIARRFDDAVAMLTAAGATTVVFTGFDPRTQLPPGRFIAGRTADYNTRIAATARRYGALLVDLWTMPELADTRLWSPDRLHLSAAGHLHVAGAVLDRLGRPTPEGWPIRLDPPASTSRLRARASDVMWSREHLLPWAVRKIRGRAAGDGRTAKHPSLTSWVPEDSSANTSAVPGVMPPDVLTALRGPR
jgi:lysophospholipase L1-like esterase